MRQCVADGVLPVPIPSEADAAALPLADPHRALCNAETPAVAHEPHRHASPYAMRVPVRLPHRPAATPRAPGAGSLTACLARHSAPACTTRPRMARYRHGALAPAVGAAARPQQLSRRPSATGHSDHAMPSRARQRAAGGTITRPPGQAARTPRRWCVAHRSCHTRLRGVSRLAVPPAQRGCGARVMCDHRRHARWVADVVKSFAPSIVHFITHGRLDRDGRGRLTLFSDEFRRLAQEHVAEQLVALDVYARERIDLT